MTDRISDSPDIVDAEVVPVVPTDPLTAATELAAEAKGTEATPEEKHEMAQNIIAAGLTRTIMTMLNYLAYDHKTAKIALINACAEYILITNTDRKDFVQLLRDVIVHAKEETERAKRDAEAKSAAASEGAAVPETGDTHAGSGSPDDGHPSDSGAGAGGDGQLDSGGGVPVPENALPTDSSIVG